MNINTYDGFCSHIFVSRETYAKFCIFYKTLIKWQNSINLISKDTVKNIWERHFLDSAQLYTFVRDVKGNVFDFGTEFESEVNEAVVIKRPGFTVNIRNM